MGGEKVDVSITNGRVSFGNVKANDSLPSFNRSLMDGYAVRDEDVEKIPCCLKVKGVIPAGKDFRGKVRKGECVKIMTGGVVPPWATRVIK
ncbi:MAG: molybdopterin molybdenumtransferase MoeA, partial [Caldiserica bacterium]